MAFLRTIDRKRARCFGSRSTAIASALAMIVVTTWAVTGAPNVVAEPTNPSNQACPSGYALIGAQPAYCFSSSGDVVEPAATDRSASPAGCRPGYDRLDTLCINAATGDVELAETPAGTRASR